MTQDYMSKADNVDKFKGQILMSSALMRDRRSIQEDGTTLFDYFVPTLTLGGTRDGLFRVTRIAESFWHQERNITPSQQNLFPVEVIEGASHYQFAGGVPPSFVQKNDLKALITDEEARKQVGLKMTEFVKNTLADNKGGQTSSSAETEALLNPFVDAMELEGSYIMKKPCYQSSEENVPTPQCLKGSPWVAERALKTLVGPITNPNVIVHDSDNFHRASTVYPYHHPQITHTCEENTENSCEVYHISCSENVYDLLDELDLGKTAIAATEVKLKMKSSQSIHVAAGETDASYEDLDDQWDECQRVNQEVLDWAIGVSNQDALKEYESVGTKLVMAKDKKALNGGSWIIQRLEYHTNADQTETEVVSISLPLPPNEIIFASMHYCKMLSPFRALEWIYIDSQYAHGGYESPQTNNQTTAEMFLQ